MRAVVAAASAALVLVHATPVRFSNVLGDDMVLSSGATPDGAGSPVWGWADASTQVSVALSPGGFKTSVAADGAGYWRVALPPQPPGLTPYTVTATAASDGSQATLSRVLFGFVVLASGQSNMAFTTSDLANATAEIAAAAAYGGRVRLFSGDGGFNITTIPDYPADEMAHIALPWANASSATVGGPSWKFFSALCWLAVKGVADALGPDYPIGAVQVSYGGTPIQFWSAPDALAACPPVTGLPCCGLRGNASCLWNSYVAPLTRGAMRFGAFIWMQGEQNGMPGVEQADYYACALPAMVASWRRALAAPSLPFGVFTLAPYRASSPADTGFPQIRLIQAHFAATDPHTFLASTLDGGDIKAGAIHSPYKERAGAHAALGLRAVALGDASAYYRGPRAASASAGAGAGGSLTATIAFEPASLRGAPLALNLSVGCPSFLTLAYCESFAVQTSDGVWRSCENAGGAGVALVAAVPPAAPVTLMLTLTGAPAGVAIVAVRNGYTPWPLVQLRNADGLPAEPFLLNTTSTALGT